MAPMLKTTLRPVVLATAFLLAPCLVAAAAPPPAPTPERAPGRIDEGSVNIRQFAPAEDATKVDATTADLRDLLDQLGPDAIEWYQHVQTLANPWFEGRAPGTVG